MTETIYRGPREWDAEVYDRISDPQMSWGLEVLERLELAGDETVLDAGCGTGRVTGALLERLPRGRVIAVDGSPAMIAKAREVLPPKVETIVADLGDFELSEPVDAVLSTAVFHWLPDHDALLGCLRAAMRPGARLVAQCGGYGNVAALAAAARAVGGRPPFDEHLKDWPGPWNFAKPEETSDRLERAGFVEVRCWLEPKLVQPQDPAGVLRTCTLGPHLERLPERLHDDFVAAVMAKLPEPLRLEYVRLNIDATADEG